MALIGWGSCWVGSLTWVCECLRSGDDVAGAPDRIRVGGSCRLDPVFG